MDNVWHCPKYHTRHRKCLEEGPFKCPACRQPEPPHGGIVRRVLVNTAEMIVGVFAMYIGIVGALCFFFHVRFENVPGFPKLDRT